MSTSGSSESTEHAVVLTQQVAASPARVYAAWLDPAELATWWWPGFGDTTYEVDARVGGAYRFRSGSAGIGAHGTFVELDEPQRIELTWFWETGGGTHDVPDRVVIDLAEHKGGTLLTLTHYVNAHNVVAGADDSNLTEGWLSVLGRLGALAD